MGEKIMIALGTFLLLFLAAFLLFFKEWLILSVFLLSTFISILYIRGNRRRLSRDLSEISEMLEAILQEKQPRCHCSNKDTLTDKIRMQILRIDEIHKGNRKTLEKEGDSMKQLLAQISHQLRNPLANMETYLALAEDDNISQGERKVYIESVGRSEQKIKFLVEKFMLAARMENRIIQIRKFPQDLKETVAQALFQIYRQAEKKRIFVEIKDKQLSDIIVSHDKNWLCEAIYNLLDNSIKYSPEGSKVEIFLKDNEMFTQISVADEGVGIEEGEENKIFHLYYRGNNISGQEGYGMGLFITRQIIAAHDGFMRVKRRQKGLEIAICLPKVGS